VPERGLEAEPRHLDGVTVRPVDRRRVELLVRDGPVGPFGRVECVRDGREDPLTLRVEGVFALAVDVVEQADESVVDGLAVTLDGVGVAREVAEQRPLGLLQRVARPASAGRPLSSGFVGRVRLLSEAGVERDLLPRWTARS
jgi:hypothetical protein